ncbi:DUF453 domain-containing protein [Fusarium mexicanum]|uniref:DUF453 domain-containing protein n=1 Tax=Fusarium mexicanum TaxID=751941 RepID=A0A8H5N214_9HYPO|nr:DUF453 domain-containing protein [Fusarium mexicanum]
MTQVSVSSTPSVFATFVRGGTSKALFFHEKDIPAPGEARDKFLIRVMGSPDPSQIDGMGGARIVTSKVAIIRPSERPDADVDYTFAQIGLGEAEVSYDGNCGNISSGVGPFSINEGLLKTNDWKDGRRVVRIYNTGKDAVLVAHVQVDKSTGRALEKGDYAISGCPGTGAPILMDYSKTASPKNVLPTGNVIDQLDCTFGTVKATFCEVGNPIVFVTADSFGIKGSEVVSAIDSNKDLIARVREVRGRMAMKLGKCSDWTQVDKQSPMLPMVALVSKSTSTEGHIQSRLFLDNRCHPSMAGTGGVCTAATSRITGSVVNRLLTTEALKSYQLVIQHPAGHLPIQVKTKNDGGDDKLPSFEALGFVRTARYLFQGQLFVPADLEDNDMSNQETVTNESGTRAKHALDDQASNNQVGNPEQGSAQDFEVTKRLASFVQKTIFEGISPEAIERLRQCLMDFSGVGELGAKVGESSPVFLKGIEAVTAEASGRNVVFGTDKRFPAQYAAFLNAAYAHTLDFDDTHTGGIIHVGVTIMATALAEAESHPDLTLKDLLLAVAVGYEVSCRIAIALGVSSWHRGFHNTSVAGIFGAVATLSKLRHLDAKQIENAFGLAVSFASGSMQYLENGSWNKRLHPAKAAHDSFIVVAMAQAGVLGAAKPIEGKYGLIAAHTDTPNAKVNVDDLGQRWEFVNTGLKPYPACRVTHTSIELASLLSTKTKSKAEEISKIHITMDEACFPIVGVPTLNKVHPNNVVDAQFSAYYQTAASWLYGDAQGWAIYDHLNDPAVHSLCDKITIEGKRLPNDLITTMIVTARDGTTQEMTLERPKWQEPERPPQNTEVMQKFRSLAILVLGNEKTEKVIEFVTGTIDAPVSQLTELL